MEKKMKSLFQLAHWKKMALLLVLYDVIAVNLAFLAALWIRFDCSFMEIS